MSHAAPPSSAPERVGARFVVADLLIVVGRLLVAATPIAVVGCRATRATWIAAPPDAGGVPDHWIPQTTLGLAISFSFAAPMLLLPWGSWATASGDDTGLTVMTVLGTRRLSAPFRTTRHIALPGRGWGLLLTVLRDDRRRRRVIISGSGRWDGDAAPAGGSVLGWLLVALWPVGVLVLLTILGTAAGLS